jgi:hypothetical protein
MEANATLSHRKCAEDFLFFLYVMDKKYQRLQYISKASVSSEREKHLVHEKYMSNIIEVQVINEKGDQSFAYD